MYINNCCIKCRPRILQIIAQLNYTREYFGFELFLEFEATSIARELLSTTRSLKTISSNCKHFYFSGLAGYAVLKILSSQQFLFRDLKCAHRLSTTIKYLHIYSHSL